MTFQYIHLYTPRDIKLISIENTFKLNVEFYKTGLKMRQKYQSMVNETIPVSQYMQWKIKELTPFKILTETKLAPNINIHGTAFAGSIYSAAMATGWTLLKCWYDSYQYKTELVAAEANIKYLSPVPEDFLCTAELSKSSNNYQHLTERMKQQKSCGFPLAVKISCQSSVCAILNVQFVFKC